MQEEYKFESGWNFASNLPPIGTRCIITDGDLVVFATYVSAGTWIIPEVNTIPEHPFKIIGWMPAPKPMRKTVLYETTTIKVSESH